MKINADITLKSDEKSYQLTIDIPGSKEIALTYDQLCFSLVRPFNDDQVVGGTLLERQGDWHRIALDQPFTVGKPISIQIQAPGVMLKATDYPEGMYLEKGNERLEVVVECPVTRNIESPDWHETDCAVFIPHCEAVQQNDFVHLAKQVNFVGEMWSVDWFERLTGRLGRKIENRSNDKAWLVSYSENPQLTTDFSLSIGANNVQLEYRVIEGFYAGQAYLLQYILQLIQNQTMRAVTVSGTPGFAYRGVHLDVVRHFFTAESIEQWIDIFALFQYKQFHWHLTDDDGWRVPSDSFPELANIASVRGPGMPLPPQMGTGMHPYKGVYSKDEIRRIVSRAAEVGMQVIPEMDLPGHARALLKAMPALQEADDKSEYLSVQHHSDNVINPAYGDTLNVVKTLIFEWSDLFPGDLFHIGSDEVPKGAWCASPSALSWSNSTKQPPENLQGLALSTIETHLNSLGKTMAGWEEVVDGGGTSSATWVYSWQGVEAGIKAASAGHPTVMTPAQYCYLDLAVTDKYDDPGYYWAGVLSLEKAYQYDPLEGVPDIYQPNIRGVQMCLWSEIVHSPQEAEYMWFPRLLAGAEVAWKSNTNIDFKRFKSTIRPWMALLSRMGFAVRAEKDQW
jgi:hexosaminidase